MLWHWLARSLAAKLGVAMAAPATVSAFLQHYCIQTVSLLSLALSEADLSQRPCCPAGAELSHPRKAEQPPVHPPPAAYQGTAQACSVLQSTRHTREAFKIQGSVPKQFPIACK